MNRIPFILPALACLLSSLVTAQGASSPSFVLSTSSLSQGVRSQSTLYKAETALLCGGRAASGRYSLSAGFTANLEHQVSGQPWLTAISPRFVTLLGQSNLSLHGTELDLGTQAKVTVAGTAINLASRVRHQIDAQLPVQASTGWQSVALTTSAGTTVLPKGIGVLPMLYTEQGPVSDAPFDVVLHGSPGDLVLWVLGVNPMNPISVPGIHSTFGVDLSVLLALPAVGIVDPDGRARFRFPATVYPTGAFYLQALFSSSNPGYGPFAFSNRIRI